MNRCTLAMAAAVFLSGASLAQADMLTFKAELTPAMEVPPAADSKGSGVCTPTRFVGSCDYKPSGRVVGFEGFKVLTRRLFSLLWLVLPFQLLEPFPLSLLSHAALSQPVFQIQFPGTAL